MARVLGLGGIFFKAKNPNKLAAWYSKWLGLEDRHIPILDRGAVGNLRRGE